MGMGGSRRDKIFELAKGFRGRSKNCFRLALRRVEKGLQHAYVGRKLKKRLARTEWIQQVGAASREHGLPYNRLINGMQHAAIGVNRKMLAVLAQQEPYSFRAIVEESKGALMRIVMRGSERAPTMVPDANASSEIEQNVLPKYDGPPLPPYPARVKQFS